MSTTAGDIIFNTGSVSVSKTLVRVEGTSYPVNGIGSVFVEKPNIVGTYLLAIVFGSTSFACITANNGGGTLLSLIAAVAFLAVALTRPSILVLRTASGDQKALRSRDQNELLTVKRAIEEAVARRG